MKEDMFSMLFVEALRPEYRYYCDLVQGNQPQKQVNDQEQAEIRPRLTYV